MLAWHASAPPRIRPGRITINMRVSALLVALAAGARAGVAQGVPMTLQQAIDHALAVQPAVVQARGTLTNAEWQKRAALGAFLPTLTAAAGAFTVNQQSVVNGLFVQPGIYQYNSSLTSNLDVFTGFGRIAEYRNATANEHAANAALVNQRYQVIVATQQAFFAVLADQDLVRVADAQVGRTKEELQTALNKFAAGAATRSDTLTSTVDLGNAKFTLLQAQANLATAEANLARQVGSDGLVEAVGDSALPPLPDTTALRASAAGNAPTVVQAEADARAASAALGVARAQWWPTLSASYATSSQGLTEPWNGFGGGNRNLNQLRIGLSWTLFNGFAREQAIAQSSAALDYAQAQAADTRRQFDALFTQDATALFAANAQIDVASANVAAATEALRVQQERYRVGAGTLLDLETAEANLTQAEANQVQARYNYVVARAQLEALVGRSL